MLRAIAVLLVLLRHLDRVPVDAGPATRLAFELGTQVGWTGVDLFFVLSGFLVTGLVLREAELTGGFDGWRFFTRRGFKIYPAFYCFLAVSVLVGTLLGERTSGRALLHEAVFLQNYLHPAVFGHTWSLAVEEHFYAALILGSGWALRRGRGLAAFRGIPVMVWLLLLGCLLLRIEAVWRGVDARSVAGSSHLRADALATGALLAWWTRTRPQELARLAERWTLPLTLLALALLSPLWLLPSLHPWTLTGGLSANAIAFALLLLLTLHPRPHPPGASAARDLVARIGRDSYSIYLWHPLALLGAQAGLDRAGPGLPHALRAALEIGVALGVGIMTARLVERPALRLRDRYYPSRAAAIAG